VRILIHGINFSPELTGIGKYSGEMADWLAEHGHEVRVVTAPPYYPQWRVAEGYANWWSKNLGQEDGLVQVAGYKAQGEGGCLDVYRCPLWIPSSLPG
jgi:colanic acid biosynthesis glycosyl transferase WcaI